VVAEGQVARATQKRCADVAGYEYPLELEDLTVTIIDRRTGTAVDEKLMKAPSTCPPIIVDGHALSTVETNDVIAWLRVRRRSH
jgi:hypothetical protein